MDDKLTSGYAWMSHQDQIYQQDDGYMETNYGMMYSVLGYKALFRWRQTINNKDSIATARVCLQ